MEQAVQSQDLPSIRAFCQAYLISTRTFYDRKQRGTEKISEAIRQMQAPGEPAGTHVAA